MEALTKNVANMTTILSAKTSVSYEAVEDTISLIEEYRIMYAGRSEQDITAPDQDQTTAYTEIKQTKWRLIRRSMQFNWSWTLTVVTHLN
ncbi:Ff.00g065550.m01.CDS01 [Fusarium sp. VM40]|nr:Ff.00g065550.m01.CDS01 [Fusarium sp. VM40]